MDRIKDAIEELLDSEQPMTCRQVFYRLVSQAVIGKTETEYKQTVIRLLGEMRREGRIPFRWIADNTRWMRKPRTWSSMESMLNYTQQTYRRAIWGDQDTYVEIWLEKDALSGVVYEITSQWDVPLMVTRGYPSLSFLYDAADAISDQDKPTYLYYFGDRDPSGIDIPRKVEESLREMAQDADITFEVVAVTEEQIDEMNLPTRPTKASDTRARTFKGESVEVDAIPPSELRKLVDACITGHINKAALKRTRLVEKAERESLQGVIRNWRGAA
ncbi:MAG: hypothetical protein HYS13_07490 [Planctomycetia bacterium]|nr:hypothetical protein [Planctomycetia bacterium]